MALRLGYMLNDANSKMHHTSTDHEHAHISTLLSLLRLGSTLLGHTTVLVQPLQV